MCRERPRFGVSRACDERAQRAFELLLHLDVALSCQRVSSRAIGSQPHQLHRSTVMGKYFFAWILGVPAVVLVGIYLLSHL
jgi:hypothetical protein